MIHTRRLAASILVLALTIVGIAAEFHNHGVTPGGSTRMSPITRGVKAPYSTDCPACKLSQRIVSALLTHASSHETQADLGKIIESSTECFLSFSYNAPSLRAPPTVLPA
jgi:hypothetical protein